MEFLTDVLKFISFIGCIVALVGLYKMKYGGETFNGIVLLIVGMAIFSFANPSGNSDKTTNRPVSESTTSKVVKEIKDEIKDEVADQIRDRIDNQSSTHSEPVAPSRNFESEREYVGTYNSGMKAYIVPGSLKISSDRNSCNVKIVAEDDRGNVVNLNYRLWLEANKLHFSNSEGYSGLVTQDMTVENKIWEAAQRRQ